jgi:hypothetical protein
MGKNRSCCIQLLEAGANTNIRILPGDAPQIEPTLPILVAYGHPFRRITPRILPQYLADSADGAFSRRKAAIRWWFSRHS